MLILLQTLIEDGTNLVDRDESHPLNLYQLFEKIECKYCCVTIKETKNLIVRLHLFGWLLIAIRT